MIVRAFIADIFLASVVLAQPSDALFHPDSAQQISINEWRYRSGDDASWSRTDFADSGWERISSDKIPLDRRGQFWLRRRIPFAGSNKATVVFLRMILLESAYDVYWDGNYIASNGKVGADKQHEIPGSVGVDFMIPIPPDMKGSSHVLGFRCSNFGASIPSGRIVRAVLESGEDVGVLGKHYAALRLSLLVGVGLACGFMGLALYLAGGRFRYYVYSALLCFALVLSKGMELALEYVPMSMGNMWIFNIAYIFGLYAAEVGIFLYLLYSFELPARRIQVPAILIVSFIFYVGNLHAATFQVMTYTLFRIATVPYACVLLFLAMRHNTAGSIIATLAYVLYSVPAMLVAFGFSIPTSLVDVSRAAVMLFPVAVSGLQVHDQQKFQRAVEIRARRLEKELLKKTIQPHFIVNTLSSVKSLARRNSPKADALVEALANEFRVLNDIVSELEIPIQSEIELCRHHLSIMGIRWGATYDFVTENLTGDERIPPLIFHTLVENALTHSFKARENGTFWLNAKRIGTMCQYRLRNNGSKLGSATPVASIEEGMGLQYVKARLEERFPGLWNLEYGLKQEMWEVLITIPCVEKNEHSHR